MNFFEFHIGDYAEATSHLSLIEHGAYLQLIKKYYATEKPLSKKIAIVCKHAGAKNRHERNTVKKILSEFFDLREDGWHNKRCDAVIAKYLAGEPDRQARKANEELRLKRFREERARLFEDLRNAGQYVPWNISMPELRSRHAELQRLSNAPATDLQRVAGVAAPVTGNGPATATHSPLPTPQSPLPNSEREGERRPRAARSAPTRIPDDFELTAERREFARSRGVDPEKAFALFAAHWRSKAKNDTSRDWDAQWHKWVLQDEQKLKHANGNGRAPVASNEAAWAEVKSRAKAIGFREPNTHDTPSTYMTDVKLAETAPRTGPHAFRALADKMRNTP